MPSDDSHHRQTQTQGNDQNSPATSAVTVVFPDHVDVHVSVASIPTELSDTLRKLSEPQSPPKSRVRNWLPMLTPVAAICVSAVLSYFAYNLNKRDSQSKLAEIRGKLIADFVDKPDDASQAITSLKLAGYGDEALPAVKMSLGSEDERLRRGAAMVAVEMYQAKTMDRDKLLNEILDLNDNTENPFLHRGILEWLVTMKPQLSMAKSEEIYNNVFTDLKRRFGTRAEKCVGQNEEFALEAAVFLYNWRSKGSKDFLIGMLENCTAEGVRNQAVNTLPGIAAQLPRPERDAIVDDLQQKLPKSSPELQILINAAIVDIQSSHQP